MFSQANLLESNIRLHFKDKSVKVIGAQIKVQRDSHGGAIKIHFIDEKSLTEGIYGITGNMSDMTEMIRTFSRAIPRTDLVGKGKYVHVSEMGNDICLMLTQEGRAHIDEDGAIDYLLDDMETGTQLSFELETEHPHIFGPSITTFITPYQSKKKFVDERIWHYPECKKRGYMAFWYDLLEDNWIILKQGKINKE